MGWALGKITRLTGIGVFAMDRGFNHRMTPWPKRTDRWWIVRPQPHITGTHKIGMIEMMEIEAQ